MRYNPADYAHRTALATGIANTIKAKGFQQVAVAGCYEDVYALPVTGRVQVRVYTSVEAGIVRDCGDDAIRVCTVYATRDGDYRGVGHETRVNRVGDINGIVVRLAERIALSLEGAEKIDRCPDCGAPKFKSKKGNWVCADLCWKLRW